MQPVRYYTYLSSHQLSNPKMFGLVLLQLIKLLLLMKVKSFSYFLNLLFPIHNNIQTKNNIIPPRTSIRSEEHTSELQSRENLVCRLLLEKKKLTQRSANA